MFPVSPYGSFISQETVSRREDNHSSFCKEERPTKPVQSCVINRVAKNQLGAASASPAAARYKHRNSRYDGKKQAEERTAKVAADSGVISKKRVPDPALLTSIIGQAPSIKALIRVYEEHKNHFNYIHLVATLNKLAKSEGGHHIHFKSFAEELVIRMRPQISKLDARSLSTAAYSFAKLNLKDKAFMADIALAVSGHIADFRPLGLANIAWAYAKVGLYDQDLMGTIAGMISDKIREFNAQDLATTAWAYGTLGVYNEALIKAIASETQTKVRTFNAQELVNTAWAYAKLGAYDEGFMDAIAGAIQSRIGELNHHGLSNTAWAYAELRVCNQDLMSAIALAVQGKIRDFTPQELSSTAWAYAKLGVYDEGFMDAIAGAIQSRIGELNHHGLSNTAWAYAELRVYNSELMSAIALAVQDKIRDFTPQELSSTAWAYATLFASNKALMADIAVEVQGKIRLFKPQELANIAWALAVFDIIDSPLLPLLKAEINDVFARGDLLGKEEMNQFIRVSDWQQLSKKVPLFIPEKNASFFDVNDGKGTFKDEVEAALAGTRSKSEWVYVKEAYIRNIHHHVDFLLYANATGKECLIEVDSPYHYSKSQTPLGSTVLRDRLLRGLGYDLVTIPYYEWDDLHTFEDQVVYLQRRLSAFLESDAASRSGSL